MERRGCDSAEAMIVYLGETENRTYTHGLALALTDEGNMSWNEAKRACYIRKNNSTPVTNAEWVLATMNQWDYMLNANGTELRDDFTSVGGTNMQPNNYWSSSDEENNNVPCYHFGSGQWNPVNKNTGCYVRACLVF
jgi:hypothetical protein